MLASWIFVVLLIALVPEAEDPWPDRIGPTAPFWAAGAGAVVGGVAFILASAARRESAVKWGMFLGFIAGLVLYVIALIG